MYLKIACMASILIVALFAVPQLETQDASPFSFGAGGGFSRSTAGGSGPLVTGYARVRSDAGRVSPTGFAIFGLRQNNVLVTEAAVPSSPAIRSGRIYAEVAGVVNTGLALANPNNERATINFYFTDVQGRKFGAGMTTLEPNGQFARFLDFPPFNAVAPVRGTFTFTSSVPISALAVRGLTNLRREFLITTLPVVDLDAPSTRQPVNFPHYADGGGWATQVMLVNPADREINGTIEFFGDVQVADLPDAITRPRRARVYDYRIPPGSSRRLITSGIGDGVRHDMTLSNWIQVAPAPGDPSPSGVAVFTYQRAGDVVSQAGVPAVGVGTAFGVFVEMNGSLTGAPAGSIQTGVAILNSGVDSTWIDLEMTTLDGRSTGLTRRYFLGKGTRAALLLSDIEEFMSLPSPFRGILRVSTDVKTPISVIGLRARINERRDLLLATLPAANESTPPSTSELIFPHFADGGGYTSQFVLLGTTRSQSGSGSIRFISPSGSPSLR